jgi:hypothetical protein
MVDSSDNALLLLDPSIFGSEGRDLYGEKYEAFFIPSKQMAMSLVQASQRGVIISQILLETHAGPWNCPGFGQVTGKVTWVVFYSRQK